MLSPPGRVLPRPMSLCLAPPGELAFLIDPDRPRHARALRARAGRRARRLRPARQRLRPRRRAAAARRRRHRHRAASRTSPRRSASPPAVLGFRSDAHAEAAASPPAGRGRRRPRPRNRLLPGRASTCSRAGPSRCSDAVARARARTRSSPGRRRWPAATAPATAARSRSTASGSGSAWKDRSLLLNASGCLDALTAPDVARQLDAFVTKTVTPLPRPGNAPDAHRRDRRRGC